ncbi:glycosyltransferase [Clostridium sp. FP1]|uniref:glycosyltransferase n=1 Tax=Clostridium sp. FP1 TaxID=2724076 RepID=UPI0013E961B1|nr:glycosyltransferase [Clostridium sp. FP1]MBZ9634149.1 glycosyltransferase [Clostridium sp. FP1]
MDASNIVSVLVLSYNNLQYIKECLNSILHQNYQYIEIIISDDYSSDFKKDEIEQFIRDNKKENIVNYVINQNSSNLGTVKNLNNAISLATGNYFINIACDDLLFDDEVITSIVKYFLDTNYLILAGYIAMFDEQLKEYLLTMPQWQYIKYIYGNPIDCYSVLCSGDFIPGPGVSYKRELINRYGMYDEEYKVMEDYPRWLYLTRKGCSIGFLQRYIVKYRKGGISMTNEEIFNDDLALVRKKEILPYLDLIKGS